MGYPVLWFTGLSGSGKTTLAKELKEYLSVYKIPVFILDGDITRDGLNSDLGFSKKDRDENTRRGAEIAKMLSDQNILVIVSFISPYKDQRKLAHNIIGDSFHEIYISTPLEECISRDPKGLYKKALSGEIENFTGVSDPYEPPTNPFLQIDTSIGIYKNVFQILNNLNLKGLA